MSHTDTVTVDTVNRSVIDEQFLTDLEQASVTVVGRTILISSGDVFSPFGFEESLREIVRLKQSIEEHFDRLMLLREPADIDAALASGKTGMYVYFQDPEPLGKHLWRLELFRDLGLKVLQMTYNQRSLTGDGCAEPGDAGLSEFGAAVIEACDAGGITVDAAHAGPRMTLETIEASSKPVLLSHTGVRALSDNPRCKYDEAIVACAKKGGVIGIAGFGSLLGNPATIETFLDHVEYIAKLVGIDHVGLGLDFITGHEADDFSLLAYKPSMYQEQFATGVPNPVPGLGSIKDLAGIRDGLRRRGFGEEDTAKVMGENFVRVFRETW